MVEIHEAETKAQRSVTLPQPYRVELTRAGNGWIAKALFSAAACMWTGQPTEVLQVFPSAREMIEHLREHLVGDEL